MLGISARFGISARLEKAPTLEHSERISALIQAFIVYTFSIFLSPYYRNAPLISIPPPSNKRPLPTSDSKKLKSAPLK